MLNLEGSNFGIVPVHWIPPTVEDTVLMSSFLDPSMVRVTEGTTVHVLATSKTLLHLDFAVQVLL